MGNPIQLIQVVGARPQIIKSAAIDRAVKNKFSHQIRLRTLHTGQHYDHHMSDIFYEELGLSSPEFKLEVEGSSHAEQTASMMTACESIFKEEKPDAIVVYGDTNSTLAAAICAYKLNIPVFHIEAGMRSFDTRMPEECNRIATDHLSTLLFCPNEHSARQLTKEGLLSHDEKPSLERPAVYIPGDVMYDNSLHYASELNESYSIQGIDLRHNDFMLASCHRPANVDEASKLTAILDALEIIASEIAPVILPIHPRLKKHQSILDKYNNSPIFSLINPVSYKEMIQLESRCKAIITDSGGLQKEAFFFKKPCVVLRENTEWEELKQNGNVLLCGNESSRIIAGTKDMISRKLTFPSFYGQGNSAEKICELIVSFASC